jgi:hypothetical protein
MRKLLLSFRFLLLAESPGGKGRLLLEAIHTGDTHAVQSALKAGADANTRDELGVDGRYARAWSRPCLAR